MTLQHGKFYIDKEQLLTYLGLPANTHLEVTDEENGIEIYAVSDTEHEYLIEKSNNHLMLRRTAVSIGETSPSIGTKYIIKDTGCKFGFDGVLSAESDEEAIKYVKENLNSKTLIKQEVLYYEK